MVADFHVETEPAPGDGLADSSKTHYTKLLVMDARRKWQARGPRGPSVGADVAIAPGNLARAAKQQGPGKVGDAVVQDIGGVADDDAARLSVGDVDRIVPDPPTDDGAKPGQGIDDGGSASCHGGGDHHFDILSLITQKGCRLGRLPVFDGFVALGDRLVCVRGSRE